MSAGPNRSISAVATAQLDSGGGTLHSVGLCAGSDAATATLRTGGDSGVVLCKLGAAAGLSVQRGRILGPAAAAGHVADGVSAMAADLRRLSIEAANGAIAKMRQRTEARALLAEMKNELALREASRRQAVLREVQSLRDPHPNPYCEARLRRFEETIWPAYMPGVPLRLRWQSGNKHVNGVTFWDSTLPLGGGWVITTELPEAHGRGYLAEYRTLFHELGHAYKGHPAKTVGAYGKFGHGLLDARNAVVVEVLDRARRIASIDPWIAKILEDDARHEAEAEAFVAAEMDRWLNAEGRETRLVPT